MANAFAVTDLVAKEALRIAHEKLQFIGSIDRQYDDSFKGDPKHGATLRVRSPNQYSRRKGSRVMSVQDQAELTQTITVGTQDGVDMRFNSQELIQSVHNDGAFDDLSRNYIEPAVSVLCSGIESDFLAFCTQRTWNTVGTAGTPPTDLVAVGAARAKLNQGLAPKDGNRAIQMDSVTMGGLVNGLKGLFQDSAQIKQQYREGMIGRTAMADWYENDRMWSLTNGSDVTSTIDAASLVVDGTNAISFSATMAAAATIGAVFTVAGVYDCHPETKAAYPSLKQFVLLSGGGTSGASTVAPTIYLTGPRQNVCNSTGALITAATFNSATMTWIGAASTSYVQNLMYHHDAFQFITADLPIMDDADKCVIRGPAKGDKGNLSIRVWQGSDIRNDELLLRLDILYGFAALRPEWACRVTS